MENNNISNREKIAIFLNDPKTFWAHLVQWLIILLILLSVAIFIIEYIYSDLYLVNEVFFQRIEWFIVSIFIIEYILRLWSSPSRKKYAISFYGIIDILAIIP
ncbi:MAG: ion transporter, partial [Patescibacteria group bacterium]